ncbi:MAG: putative Fe-S cluster assembly protein SufT [Terriglobia bacterium]
MANQIVALTRDCPAAEVPSGYLHLLSAGTPVIITQNLGGSYTITSGYGQLMRIDAKDADALGFEAAPQKASSTEFSEEAVWEELKMVFDPEIPVNIVDLGLVYTCEISEANGDHNIAITMTMTAPGCGMGDVLKEDVERRLTALPTVKAVNVEIVFEPAWTYDRMSEATRLQLGLD